MININVCKLIIGSLNNKEAICILEKDLFNNQNIYEYQYKNELKDCIKNLKENPDYLFKEYSKLK